MSDTIKPGMLTYNDSEDPEALEFPIERHSLIKGDPFKWRKSAIYVDGHKIGEGTIESVSFEPDDEPDEVPPQSFHATGTCILSDASPISKMLKQWKKREHQNIKQLLWAVTHGYTVHFKFIVKDKHGRMHQEFYQVDRPRKLKALLRAIHVIPQYIIVDRQGNAFSLRHGKWHYYGSILYRPKPNWDKLYGGNEDLIRDTNIILEAMKVDPRLYK